MSNPSAEDLLIFVGIPLAVIAIVFALVYVSGARNAKRYRPGRPYTYAAVWFLARPETDGPKSLASGPASKEISAAAAGAAPSATTTHPGLTGGASDRW